MKNFLMTLAGVAFAAALWFAPSEASAANCNFNKNEKISMVSWIIPIAGAVMTTHQSKSTETQRWKLPGRLCLPLFA